MKRMMLLAGLAMTAICSVAVAQDETIKLHDYVDYLIDTYGANADVLTSNLNGFDEDARPFTEIFPAEVKTPRESQIHSYATTAAAEQTCQALGRPILAQQTAGAYAYRWCWSNLQTGSVTYEAKRDTWISQAGRLTYFVSSHYNCQSTADLAAMPSAVKAARCYQ